MAMCSSGSSRLGSTAPRSSPRGVLPWPETEREPSPVMRGCGDSPSASCMLWASVMDDASPWCGTGMLGMPATWAGAGALEGAIPGRGAGAPVPMGATGAAPIPMGARGAGAAGFAGFGEFAGFAGLATGFFLGRPRPGPGRRVMGFWLGSLLRALELMVEGARPLESALFWARRRPWKCWLGGRVSFVWALG